jgi:hypothetical protein
MGNFWLLEATVSGSNLDEHFGHSLDISDDTLLIGNNPSTYQAGRAVYYKRNFGTSTIEDNPLVSGPLYNTVWSYVSALADSLGADGDHFGFSVSFYGNVAVVGAIMNDIQSDGTFGQGVAYIKDQLTMTPVVLSAPTPSPVSVGERDALLDRATDTNTLFGIEVMSSSAVLGFILVLGCSYLLYRGTGGEASPRELLCGFSGSPKPPPKQVRLASMDDSGFSSTSTSSANSKNRMSSTYSGLDTSDTSSSHVRMNSRPNTSPSLGPGPSFSSSKSAYTPAVTDSQTPVTPPPGAPTTTTTTASSNPYLAQRANLSAGAQRSFTPKSNTNTNSEF